MYSVDIEEALLCDHYTAPIFRGVFAADTLPKSIQKPAVLVVNTDPQHKSGSHWVSIFIDVKGRGEFFDSFGLPPIVATHHEFLSRTCSTWTYNARSLQGFSSKVCGEYCVLYLVHRARGVTLQEFLWHFKGNNAKSNDKFVKNKFTKLFGSIPFKTKRGLLCRGQKCHRRVSPPPLYPF
jgi:hypothetical protein